MERPRNRTYGIFFIYGAAIASLLWLPGAAFLALKPGSRWSDWTVAPLFGLVSLAGYGVLLWITHTGANIWLGRAYLARMYRRYGNWQDAIAAYNWGPGNLDTWIGGGRAADKLPLKGSGWRDQSA